MISTPDERVWRLSELDLFADLTQDEMDRIGAAAPMRQVGRGELLYGPHRPAEVLFILKAGRVRLYRTAADGRSLTTSIVVPGELFGVLRAGWRAHGKAFEGMKDRAACDQAASA